MAGMARITARGAPTIGDIAKVAGVSRATVSRVFSRPDLISTETIDRVREVADQLGWTPNQMARALSTGKQGNIAVILPDIANPFFPPLIRAAQRTADAAGMGVFIGDTDNDQAQEFRLASRLGSQIEGFVLASSRMSEDHIRQIASLRPVVLINRDIAGLSRVLIDAHTGLDGAVGALSGLGHRHVVYVAGPEVSWSDQQRRAALSNAGRRHGVRIEVIEGVEGTFEGGRAATDQVAATGATGAIAFDDFVAHGLLAGLAGRGLSVPDEFSLVGFDDVLGASTHPSLSSVFAPGQDAGRRAMELLLEQLETGVAGDRRELLETRFIARATTGPAIRR
jgi:DNA-binding LacI/PurR family transcriptional regulator